MSPLLIFQDHWVDKITLGKKNIHAFVIFLLAKIQNSNFCRQGLETSTVWSSDTLNLMVGFSLSFYDLQGCFSLYSKIRQIFSGSQPSMDKTKLNKTLLSSFLKLNCFPHHEQDLLFGRIIYYVVCLIKINDFTTNHLKVEFHQTFLFLLHILVHAYALVGTCFEHRSTENQRDHIKKKFDPKTVLSFDWLKILHLYIENHHNKPILLIYILVSKFLFLEFPLLLSRVAPYLSLFPRTV